MTDDLIDLQALLAKPPDADIVRERLGFPAQRLMEPDVETSTGAAHGERTPDRLTQRNAYRDRTWETRVGTIELRIPVTKSSALALYLRKGSYFAEFPEPRRVSEDTQSAPKAPKRSRPSCRKPASRAPPPARSTNWSGRWG
jgi:transposase-like protein